MKFFLIGCGKVGTAFTVHLMNQGHQCIGMTDMRPDASQTLGKLFPEIPFYKTIPPISVDFVIVTVNDDNLQTVDDEFLEPIQYHHIFHTSGFSEAAVLPYRDLAKRLSIHPLISMPDVESAVELLPTASFGIEGEDYEWGAALVREMGALPFPVTGAEKTMYHIAAVFAGTFTVAPIQAASVVMNDKNEGEFIDRYLPLIRSVLINLERRGVASALSGPVQRNDTALLQKQARLLRSSGLSDEADLYEAIVRYLQLKRQKRLTDV